MTLITDFDGCSQESANATLFLTSRKLKMKKIHARLID